MFIVQCAKIHRVMVQCSHLTTWLVGSLLTHDLHKSCLHFEQLPLSVFKTKCNLFGTTVYAAHTWSAIVQWGKNFIPNSPRTNLFLFSSLTYKWPKWVHFSTSVLNHCHYHALSRAQIAHRQTIQHILVCTPRTLVFQRHWYLQHRNLQSPST